MVICPNIQAFRHTLLPSLGKQIVPHRFHRKPNSVRSYNKYFLPKDCCEPNLSNAYFHQQTQTSGSVGYAHGPKSELYEGSTSGDNIWGEAKSGAALSAFYRFMFDPEDVRRDYLNGLWGYLYNGEPTISVSYTVYNNKWSKLWSTSGNPESAGNTGINFPYMRYTDVLLMYAEAANELNDGPTDAAKAALHQVRQRAFTNPEKIDSYIESMSGSKEDFLKAVLDERKFEFAGENMLKPFYKDLCSWQDVPFCRN